MEDNIILPKQDSSSIELKASPIDVNNMSSFATGAVPFTLMNLFLKQYLDKVQQGRIDRKFVRILTNPNNRTIDDTYRALKQLSEDPSFEDSTTDLKGLKGYVLKAEILFVMATILPLWKPNSLEDARKHLKAVSSAVGKANMIVEGTKKEQQDREFDFLQRTTTFLSNAISYVGGLFADKPQTSSKAHLEIRATMVMGWLHHTAIPPKEKLKIIEALKSELYSAGLSLVSNTTREAHEQLVYYYCTQVVECVGKSGFNDHERVEYLERAVSQLRSYSPIHTLRGSLLLARLLYESNCEEAVTLLATACAKVEHRMKLDHVPITTLFLADAITQLVCWRKRTWDEARALYRKFMSDPLLKPICVLHLAAAHARRLTYMTCDERNQVIDDTRLVVQDLLSIDADEAFVFRGTDEWWTGALNEILFMLGVEYAIHQVPFSTTYSQLLGYLPTNNTKPAVVEIIKRKPQLSDF